MTGVYLIHATPPYKHAAHYIGYSDDIERRVEEHRRGQGARLTEVMVGAGCELQLARTWEGKDRNFERKLHKRKGANKFCPICKGEHNG